MNNGPMRAVASLRPPLRRRESPPVGPDAAGASRGHGTGGGRQHPWPIPFGSHLTDSEDCHRTLVASLRSIAKAEQAQG